MTLTADYLVGGPLGGRKSLGGAKGFAASGAMTPTAHLTPMEYKVLRLAALGYTFKEIGQIMGRSTVTMRNHAMKVYRKCEGQCLVDALRAIGWLVVPEDPE